MYDSAGVFQYGYSFHTLGSFGLGWDGDNVLIYLVRSGTAVLVDPTGSIPEISKIDDTPENNSYWYSVRTRQRIRGSDKYTIKNSTGISRIFALDSSKLVKTDQAGNETIIYDAGRLNTAKYILGFAALVSFIAVAIFTVAKETKAAIDKM